MKCKICVYFLRLDNKHFGHCNNIKMQDDDHLFDKTKAECLPDGVLATCDEYRGELLVGEDFGCIHFEKTDE